MNIENYILTKMENDKEIQKLGWNMKNINELAKATDKLLRFAGIYNENTHTYYKRKVKAIAHTIAKYINDLIDQGQYTPTVGGLGFVYDKRQDFVDEAFGDFCWNLEIEEKYIKEHRYDKETLTNKDFMYIFPEKLPIVVHKRQQKLAKNKKRMEQTLEAWNKEDMKKNYYSTNNAECAHTFYKHCVNQRRKR